MYSWLMEERSVYIQDCIDITVPFTLLIVVNNVWYAWEQISDHVVIHTMAATEATTEKCTYVIG